jgi:hypothetical protein
MKKSKTIRCPDVAKHICENLDEKINSPICREIKKHLQTCPDCSANLLSLKKTVKLYRRYPIPKLSRLCHKELMAKLSAIRQ